MKTPRDIDGDELAAFLTQYGYTVTRQAGSHMRLTTQREGEHHITIPRHHPLKQCVDLGASQGQCHQVVAERLDREHLAVGNVTISLTCRAARKREVGADAADR